LSRPGVRIPDSHFFFTTWVGFRLFDEIAVEPPRIQGLGRSLALLIAGKFGGTVKIKNSVGVSLYFIGVSLFGTIKASAETSHLLNPIPLVTGVLGAGRYEDDGVEKPKPVAEAFIDLDEGRFEHLLQRYKDFIPKINQKGSEIYKGVSEPLREGAVHAATKVELWYLGGRLNNEIASLKATEKKDKEYRKRVAAVAAELDRAELLLRFAIVLQARKGEKVDDDTLVTDCAEMVGAYLPPARKRSFVLYSQAIMELAAPPGTPEPEVWAKKQVARMTKAFGKVSDVPPKNGTAPQSKKEAIRDYLLSIADDINNRDDQNDKLSQLMLRHDPATEKFVGELEGWPELKEKK
jgi:hypothetical protein